MKDFFKPEDFKFYSNVSFPSYEQYQKYVHSCVDLAADIANKKLMKNAKIVYGHNGKSVDEHFPDAFFWRPDKLSESDATFVSTHKALLICIEPIVKCDHSAEKIELRNVNICNTDIFKCRCGASVKIKSFEEI